MRQNIAAQHVWDALTNALPEGLTFQEICRETGLSGSQVRHGLKYVDDVLQIREGRPRAWHPYRKVYTLSETWAEHRPYIDMRWKSILTQMRRQERNLRASLDHYGTDVQAVREIMAKLTSVQGAIRDIEAAMFGGPTSITGASPSPSPSSPSTGTRRVVRRTPA